MQIKSAALTKDHLCGDYSDFRIKHEICNKNSEQCICNKTNNLRKEESLLKAVMFLNVNSTLKYVR